MRDNKTYQVSLFSIRGNFSVNRKDLRTLTIVGLTGENLVLDPLDNSTNDYIHLALIL